MKGYGWTGKTVVACHRALRLQKQNKRILFLCFGKALSNFLSIERFPYKLVYLQSFYDEIRVDLEREIKKTWFLEYDGGVFRLGIFDKMTFWVEKSFPYFIYETWWGVISENHQWSWTYANQQKEDFLSLLFRWYKDFKGNGNFLYDEIFIDEAQDIAPDVLKSLMLLAPHFSIFADENQRIIWDEWSGSSIKEIAQTFFPNASNPEDQVEELTINMRSTKEISEYAARYFLPEDEGVKMITQSRNCKSIPESFPEEKHHASLEGQKAQIKKWIEQAKINSWSLTIFCGKTKMIDSILVFLNDNKIAHWAYYNGLDSKNVGDLTKIMWFSESVFISTHHSSKGLEADAVILIVDKSEFDNYMEAPEGDRANNILYVLATRAKKKLYILFTFEEDN